MKVPVNLWSFRGGSSVSCGTSGVATVERQQPPGKLLGGAALGPVLHDDGAEAKQEGVSIRSGVFEKEHEVYAGGDEDTGLAGSSPGRPEGVERG